MLIRGVVHDHIHDDADVSFLRFGDKLVEVREITVLGVDIFVVGDVVTKVNLGRRVDR